MKCNNTSASGQWISTLHRQLNLYLADMLRDKEINPSEYIYIVSLDDKEYKSQEELSEQLTISKSATAKAMKRLEKLELIDRIVDETDRRAYKITLTTKGLSMKKYLFSVLSKWAKIVSIGVDKDEEDRMIQILMQMSNNLVEYRKGNIDID